jgi:4-hydroxybenzoate polyprenyltransferase
MITTVKKYLSLVKFSHTIFAMPFALIGFVLGVHSIIRVAISQNGSSSVYGSTGIPLPGFVPITFEASTFSLFLLFFLVILCMIFARSAAMAFNRWADASWDAQNPRTAIREIPKGIITPNNALAFVIVNCVLFITATFFINRLCFYLSPIALLVVLGYSYTKRFTPLCHLILGVGLALAPIGAYIAVTGKFALLPILFSFAVLFWVSGFDIIYALQDEEFDRSNKLHSMPVYLGKAKALRLSEMLHVLSAVMVLWAGKYGQFGWLYWIGAVVFCGMLIYQHSVVKPNDLRRVNLAFMTANGIASVVFAVFVIADLLLL